MMNAAMEMHRHTGRAGDTEGRDLIQNWKTRWRRQSITEGFLEGEAVELSFER